MIQAPVRATLLDTFSAENTAVLPPPHRLRLSCFVVALFLFILVNIGFSFAQPLFFAFVHLLGRHMTEKVALAEFRASPDLLFMGSSRGTIGFDSGRAAQLAGLQRHQALNLSIVASAADMNYLILKNYILPKRKPQTIVYALSEFDTLGLAPGNNRYRSLLRLPYGSSLERVDDWELYLHEPGKKQSQFVANCLLPLYRDRKVVIDAVDTVFKQKKIDWNVVAVMQNSFDFVTKPHEDLSEQTIAAMDAGYRLIVPSYDPNNPNFSDLSRFVSLAKRNKIRVLLVNMPVTKQFQGYWKNKSCIEKYRQSVRDFAADQGVDLLDLYVPTSDFTAECFWDTNHLSGKGADLLTTHVMRQLARPAYSN